MGRRRLSAIVLVALAGTFLGVWATPKSPAGRVVSVTNMHARRADHTATLLRDGRVLITGGMVENGVFLASAEIFDPAKQAFIPAANMLSRRVGHSATLLPNGKVLIAGGLAGRAFEGGSGIVASTELFDPATGRFTAGPPMTTPRTGHAAVLLPNKTVLIAGGADHGEQPLVSAEIYDPATNRFTPTAGMKTARIARSAVLLHDGRVLVTGGGSGTGPAIASAELFDPRISTWHSVGDMTSPREKHAAVVLNDGRVLIIGGSPDGQWHASRNAELFDPHTERFIAVNEMELARFKFPDAAALLNDGRVLLGGGADQFETYDPGAGKFVRVGSIAAPNYFASATRLKDGAVLVTGGYGTSDGRSNGPLSSDAAWLYIP